jgi:hypothetical protein
VTLGATACKGATTEDRHLAARIPDPLTNIPWLGTEMLINASNAPHLFSKSGAFGRAIHNCHWSDYFVVMFMGVVGPQACGATVKVTGMPADFGSVALI